MSVNLSTVLNDVAQKFMQNNQKVEESNLKKDVKKEMTENNKIISQELLSLREQIQQIGGQLQKQQNVQPMPYPMMMQPQMMMAPMQPQMMMPQPQAQPTNNKKAGKKKGANNNQAADNNQGANNKKGEPEKTVQQLQANEIDEEIQRRELNNLEKKTEESVFAGPERIIGSIGSAAASVLGAGNETDVNMGPAAGKPIELPSLNNIESSVSEGLDQAANTMKTFTGLNKEAPDDDSTILSRVTSSVVDGVKKIGQNALGTAETAANITNEALKFTKHRKCNQEFLTDLPNIIDTCDRDNYVVIFNTILEKLKLRKDNFRDIIKNQIEEMKPINLDLEDEIQEDENTLTTI